MDIKYIRDKAKKQEFILSAHAHEERQAESIGYGDCHYCSGEVEEQKIRIDFWWEGKLFIIEDVPAGLCKQCGEKYFTAKVSKAMDELVKSSAVEKVLQIPVKRFKEAFAV